MIYLDNCATTEVDEDVAYAAFEMMREFYGNPSSPYGLGRTALRKITEARHQVAQVIGAPTERLFLHLVERRRITWLFREPWQLWRKKAGL